MRVVAIVPAYNEEKTVGNVIEVLRSLDRIDEVVVVSDGSRDSTAEVARRAGATVLELRDNVGKGGAMKTGIESTTAGVFLFLDADLIGLAEEHVTALIAPVVDGSADMTVGIFERGRAVTDIAQVVAPQLSGQRAVKAKVLSDIPELEVARFGVEIALTRYAKHEGIRVLEVPLKGLTHVMKEEKMGLSKGFVARMKMYWDIIRAHAANRD
ncbi:MAG: glycosyltransferase family 2 protein [Firmicutes bacterium]|nr:glycosyltransferase family 2 protein [Bacillota bacterium]